MSYHNRFDWEGFFVQFVLGAVVGLALGFGIWVKSPQAASISATPGYFYMGGTALVCGIVAGCIGDCFWHALGRWFRWW